MRLSNSRMAAMGNRSLQSRRGPCEPSLEGEEDVDPNAKRRQMASDRLSQPQSEQRGYLQSESLFHGLLPIKRQVSVHGNFECNIAFLDY